MTRGLSGMRSSAAVAVALLLPACQGRVAVGSSIVQDVPAPPRYADVVAGVTRELRLYDGLSTALLMRATLLDDTMRRALEAERAHLYLLEPPVAAERLAASLAEGERSWVFVITADSQWRDDLRLSQDDSEPWRIRLFSGENACAPEGIAARKKDPLDKELYPHRTSWDASWEARFSRTCGDRPLVLQVTGPHGTGELGY